VLAGFVLARAAAGLADGTISSDVVQSTRQMSAGPWSTARLSPSSPPWLAELAPVAAANVVELGTAAGTRALAGAFTVAFGTVAPVTRPGSLPCVRLAAGVGGKA